MSSLSVSASAEDLHTSEVHRSCAHKAKKSGWFGPWNVLSKIHICIYVCVYVEQCVLQSTLIGSPLLVT